MIPLYKPFMPKTPLIKEILCSGQLAYGKYGVEFEKLLANYFGVSNVITTNSYNMAMLVTLSTLGIKAGDTVIASPMACLASTQPLLSMGIKVKWADVDPTTGTLSPDSVRHLMNIEPKAIIHNHFCGHVGYVDEINLIGKEYNIPVIDDCIEAFGSEFNSKKMGNVGTDVTVFSFGPVRIPNTLDGGAIIFKDKSLYKKSLLVRDAGIDRTRFRDELGEINPDCDIELVGYNAKMDEVSSYIGVQQMKNIEWILETQRNNALIWNEKLKGEYDIVPINEKHSLPNYWVYGTLAERKRERILDFREKGFYASGVHINNNIYTVFGDTTPLKGVNEFNNKFVALPCGWWVDFSK
ncbi:DegT/DnrJ/EryC1/StrS family aminotransferase [Halobacillus yeomjeoni]|uniref:DegT/DnrJ/EryC1/StrS family aminotransferase n=1 Tax=Halobacillus yeomjeoni TaxID=311194 RepID=A0A931HWK7_9BACI|nr:DegT/DnrJ/EryC1/StrS family aminotransferase [Halobacillus yeomjeoni]MBH0230754.1 DegT/DnrJ/EryC1/StrS family aminotransferase [Halobacillus yeomjeoni]